MGQNILSPDFGLLLHTGQNLLGTWFCLINQAPYEEKAQNPAIRFFSPMVEIMLLKHV